jgi:uncharacterized repeat protein (TIGR01451 family)
MKKLFTTITVLLLISQTILAANFTVTNVNNSGQGSFRQAILDANAASGADNILFAIPGAGPHFITPSSDLPEITGATLIEGYSQSGSIQAGATWPAKIQIVLQGSYTGTGLKFASTATGSSVKGLSIVGFGNTITDAAIYIKASNMTISGNLIGLLPDGTVMGNSVGIYAMAADFVTIGGPSASDRNVVSGNTWEGITFMPDNLNYASSETIQNNYVGTDVTGTKIVSGPTNQPCGNGLHGIDFDGANNSYILDNVIGGNGGYGCGIDATYAVDPPYIQNITVMRNRIGIGLNGEDLGNVKAGIMVINATNLIIGSSVANANIIAYNHTGVVVLDYPAGTSRHSVNVQITYNRIFNNDNLGIDLSANSAQLLPDGVTINDALDPDVGPNNFQNFPVLTEAYVNGTDLIIKGSLNSIPNQNYKVVFFNNPHNVVPVDPTGYGECYQRIGLIDVTTDGSGNASFVVTYPNGANYRDNIVSFARSATENTSEFSHYITVGAVPDSVCKFVSAIHTYHIDATGGATSYTWTVSPGAVITSGQGTTTATVDWSALGNGTYEVCVTSNNSCGISPATCLPVVIYQCATDLQITKSDNPDPVAAGNTLTYSVIVTNNGTITAKNVSVTDDLPAGLTLNSALPSPGSWSSPTWTIGDLAAGGSATLTLTTTVNQGFTGSTLTNTATVSSTTLDTDTGNNSDTELTQANKQADVSVSKSCTTSPVVAGQQINYTIQVQNNGPSDALNVSLEEVNPSISNLQYSLDNATWMSWSSPFSLGTLHAGNTESIYLKGIVLSSVTGSLSNTATVTTSTTDPNTANNSSTVNSSVTATADLSIIKTTTSQAVQGDTIHYTLTIQNHGPSDAPNITITDNIIADILNPQYSTDGGSNWYNWTGSLNVSSLINGATYTVLLQGTLTSTASSPVTNTATVSLSPDIDPVTSNDVSTVSNALNEQADLGITKTASPSPVTAGNTITYTITVHNYDVNFAAQSVVIYDYINSSYISSPEYSTDNLNWSSWTESLPVGSIAVGSDFILYIRGTVLPSVTGSIPNTANVSSNTPDPTPNNNEVAISTPVESKADLGLVKTGPVSVNGGSTLQYTLTATNYGPSVAASVTLTDNIPVSISNAEFSLDNGVNWQPWSGSYANGTLGVNGTLSILIKGDVSVNTCSAISNTATVTSSTSEPSPETHSNSSTISTPVNDITSPTISCPAPRTVRCAADVPAYVNNYGDFVAAGGSVTDNCSSTCTVVWVSDDISNQNCTNQYTITRTYRATDANGNSATCQQTITVNDDVSPAIASCPSPVSVKCTKDVPVPVANYASFNSLGGSASDNCTASNLLVVLFQSDAITNQSCSNRYTLTRTYRVEDECGNFSLCTQTINVYDDIAPTFTPPAAITISCETPPIPDNTGVPTIDVGNCGGTNQTYSYSDQWTSGPGCNGTGVILRTWTVTDQCGNQATHTQTITINDNTLPQISCVGNQNRNTNTGLCYYETVSTEFDPTLATDNCGVQSVLNNFNSGSTLSGAHFPVGTTTVVWTITDNCNNTATCSLDVIITDDEFPAITKCPENRTIEGCNLTAITGPAYSSSPASSTHDEFTGLDNQGIVTENCSIQSYTYQDVVNGSYPFVVTRTWSITDNHGNTSTCNQTITVNDNAPTAVNDDYVMVQNTTEQPTSLTARVTLNDYDTENQTFTVTNWGSPSTPGITFTTNANGQFTYVPPLAFTGVVTFTYTISDLCRTSTATVTIYVISCLTTPETPDNVIRN